MISRDDRIAGGLVGLLIGDALGCPYEFKQPGALPALDAIEMTPPAGFDRAHHGTPPGTWTDDGAMALCLLASLLERGRLDLDDLGRRFVNWYEHGYMAVDGRVFDVGIQTADSLRSIGRGVPAMEAGKHGEYDNGNGSLMRVLPLALWHRGSDAELVADAHAQSLVTHAHPRSQVCCALYCLWARRALADEPDPWNAAVIALRGLYASGSPFLAELEWQVRPDDFARGNGSGYVVDCLRSARWAVAQGDYQQAVKAAISLGNDTDTTACVAGGIAGLRDGLQAIPERWRTALRGEDLYRPLLGALLDRYSV